MRVREAESSYSDFDDLDYEEDGRHDGPIAVAWIAALPLLFAVGMIFLAYWLVR